jgi:DNA-binding GntR family transcriptional regulator
MTGKRIMTVKFDQYKPLREVVLDTMREAILQQVIKPGERLMESRLADDMGVSRTPIREAIRQLELEGYLVMIPRKGAYVSEISLKDIHEVYEIRSALEILASGLAAERATEQEIEQMGRCIFREAEVLNDNIIKTVEADTDLHNLIYQASRNDRLMAILNKLREQIYRMRVVSTALPGRRVKSLGYHRDLVEAISQRDVERAEKIAGEHMLLAEESMIQHFKNM